MSESPYQWQCSNGHINPTVGSFKVMGEKIKKCKECKSIDLESVCTYTCQYCHKTKIGWWEEQLCEDCVE